MISNVNTALVPGGSQKIHQGSRCVMELSHSRIDLSQTAFDYWMAETEHEITSAGQVKAPSRDSCVEKILSAWESLLNAVTKKSFEACAISLPVDGWKDEKINCFKPDNP